MEEDGFAADGVAGFVPGEDGGLALDDAGLTDAIPGDEAGLTVDGGFAGAAPGEDGGLPAATFDGALGGLGCDGLMPDGGLATAGAPGPEGGLFPAGSLTTADGGLSGRSSSFWSSSGASVRSSES